MTQVKTYQLWLTGTVVTHREHTAQIIVNCTCKYTSQHYPKVSGRSELGTHDSSEDRASSGNVQELNHEHFPIGQNNKINAIGLRNGWGDTVVRSENALYKLAVNHIAYDESDKTNQKCYHFTELFINISAKVANLFEIRKNISNFAQKLIEKV